MISDISALALKPKGALSYSGAMGSKQQHGYQEKQN
jgi:hypothetical protein